MERRFRLIAPKPTPPMPPPMAAAAASSVLWRPRKRGREDHHDLLLSLAVSAKKRERAEALPPPSSYPMVTTTRGGRSSSVSMPEGLVAGCEERLRTLSLVAEAGSPAAASPWPAPAPPSSAATARPGVIPVERDLISKLEQVPRVIKPRPARPLCTTVCIDSSSIVGLAAAAAAASKKTAREVEAELEYPGALPAIVSGHRNRVHLVNEAYKAMVGQPVCPWLDSLPGGGAGASRRINATVVLDVRTFGPAPPRLPNTDGGSSDAFPCTARISWVHGGGSAIASLTVPCNVEHLTGSSSSGDDYHFIWRFDSSRASIIYCIV